MTISFFRFFIVAFFFLQGSIFSSHATAQDNDTLVFESSNNRINLMEVFVSQGCSSCPPSEEWISTLKNNPRLWKDIFPVVFHVDYWDYIGWKDVFASKAYTKRQYEYKKKGYVKSVYTPGFVLNGKEWNGWFHKRALPKGKTAVGTLKGELDSNNLKVAYSENKSRFKLNVAILGLGLQTDVKGGENRGHTLKEDFTVLFFKSYLSKDGQWDIRLPERFLDKTKLSAVIFWVSEKNDPMPLQAAGGWIPAQVLNSSVQ